MADPSKYTNQAIPTQATLDQAQADKLAASLKAAGVGISANVINRQANAPGGPAAQALLKNLFTGTSATPTATGPASVRVTRGTIFTAFLPAPYGYVPPEFYGLHPSFTEETLGIKIPAGATFGFRGTQARVDVYNAAARVEQINRQINAYRGFIATASANANLMIEPLPGLSVADYLFLKALPPGSTRLQFYVTQYAPKYEAILSRIEADGLAQFQAAYEAGQRAQNDYLARLGARTARVPDPQFDDVSAGGGGDYGADAARVAKFTEGYALRVAAAEKSMDP